VLSHQNRNFNWLFLGYSGVDLDADGDYLRCIVCPACGEESVDKLPVYVAEGAEELQHVRVEACDTCRHYIKTIDLTKNGRAVPVVDELAAIPLSLWAAENGYTKVSTNLLGL